MSARHRTSRGLAARIVRVTSAVGMVTVLIAGAVSLFSVSNLASERAASHDLLALRFVEGSIEQRLRITAGVLDRAGALATQSKDQKSLSDSLVLLASGNRAMFSEFAVIRLSDAKTLVSVPGPMNRKSVRTLPAFVDAVRGGSGFSSAPDTDGVPTIWGSRTVVTGFGTPVVVLARLDDGFLRQALQGAVDGRSGSVALLLDSGRLVGSAGSDEEFVLSGAQWTSSSGALGNVRIRDKSGRSYVGYYYDIDTAGDMSWRAVAAEPAQTDIRATLATVAPPIVILLMGGVISSFLAWFVTGRLVRPLRELERTARAAASGAYVRPLSYEGDDEVGRVAGAFNQVALRLNALHDLSQLLASASRLDQVLDGILSAMEHIVGRGSAAIYLVDKRTARLVPARTHGVNMANVGDITVESGGWLVEAMGSSGPAAMSGTSEEIASGLPGLTGRATTAIAAPLVAGNDVLGVVVILRETGAEISEAEFEMIRTFSAQAAVAVQTSRLFQVESTSRRIAEALREVAEHLVRPEELEIALESVKETIRNLFGASVVRIAFVDRERLGLAPGVGADDGLLYLAIEVTKENREAVVFERGADPVVDALLEEYDSERVVIVPIALDTDHGAALIIALPGRIYADGLEVARALSDEIALALDNAYFYERALARAANLETIFRISQAVASPLQINVVLNRVLDVVQKILSADAVMLWSYDVRRRALGTAMVRGDVPAAVVGLELEPGEDLPGRVFQSGEPIAIRELMVEMGGVAGSAARQQLHSLLAVPLLARGRPIGVLMVLAAERQAFSDEDLNVLQTFASQAALAIDTARLYSREHEVAHVLQQSILPSDLPEFSEIETGSVYAPAGGDADIGGDYYDLFRGPDDTIWFVIADVCGKGVHAATKTSMIKYAMRAFAASGASPSGAASEVNRMVSDAGDASDIVTLWAGRYDVEAGTLTWSDGGHPPAVVRRSDGAIEELGTTGPILGALRDVVYEEGNTPFGPGDKLLLYTDGVTEARQGNIFFGGDRVAAALTADRSAQEDARRLLQSVRDFVHGDLRDDVAALVISVRKD